MYIMDCSNVALSIVFSFKICWDWVFKQWITKKVGIRQAISISKNVKNNEFGLFSNICVVAHNG
jgi:hypothetical protein